MSVIVQFGRVVDHSVKTMRMSDNVNKCVIKKYLEFKEDILFYVTI